MTELDSEQREDAKSGLDEVDAVSTELVRSVEAAIDEHRLDDLRALVVPMHSADIARLLYVLKRDDRNDLVEALGDDLDPEVLVDLEGQVLADLLDVLRPRAIARAIQELDTDDAVYLLENLDEDQRERVLAFVPAPDRAAVVEGLTFPEESAGRLMQRDFVAVPAYWTVGQVIDYCREADNLPDEFYEIYVIDPRFRPIGHVSLYKLMRTKRPVLMREIMEAEGTRIPLDMDQEQVAFLFVQYRMPSAPVVDGDGRLVGVITFDDAQEVLEDEAEEDMMALSGVAADSDIADTALRTTRLRATWLLVNLCTAILASLVIAVFSSTIEQIVALAVLMPIVASMGGNAGTQTLTVAVRALATRDLTPANTLRVVGKEVVVGGLNGVLFAVLMGMIAGLWYGEFGIGLVIATAMVVNLLIAGLAGVLIPLGLNRAGIDPAVSGSVFLTTVTDVVGFFVFLGLAAIFLL